MLGCMSYKMSKFTEILQQVVKNKYQSPKIISNVGCFNALEDGGNTTMMMETIGGG